MAATQSMLQRRPKVRPSQEVGGTFRILIGVHYGPGPVGCTCENCEQVLLVKNADGTTREVKGTNHCYQAWLNPAFYKEVGHPENHDDYKGDIIVTDVDLVSRFAPGKFERLNEAKLARESNLESKVAELEAKLAALQPQTAKEQPKAEPTTDLEVMSEQQLKEYAATHGVDVKGLAGKGALLRAIRAKH